MSIETNTGASYVALEKDLLKKILNYFETVDQFDDDDQRKYDPDLSIEKHWRDRLALKYPRFDYLQVIHRIFNTLPLPVLEMAKITAEIKVAERLDDRTLRAAGHFLIWEKFIKDEYDKWIEGRH